MYVAVYVTYESGDSKYMALELLNGQSSTAADMFSLGLLLFELATGWELPSSGPAWQELRTQDPSRTHNTIRQYCILTASV